MQNAARCIVIGGGVSGLAAAFFLEQRGIGATLIERTDALGGRVGAAQLGDRWLDCGGKNIGREYRLFRQFVSSLGTHRFEPFGLNSSQAVDGAVKTFDASARWRTLAGLAGGMSPRDLLRFGHLLVRVKLDEAAGFLGSSLSRQLATRYDDAPASRHFSPEFCRTILRPISVRMNGAEPDEVYMGNLGSNARMILDTYDQLSGGLAPVLRDCLARYDVRLNTTAEALLVERGRVTGVRVNSGGKSVDVEAAAGVILATPSHTAASLLDPVLPAAARHLRSIAYHPVALVIAEYDRPIFTAARRAFVFGADSAVSNAGAYGVNDLNLVRYTFSGRTARGAIAGAVDAADLLHAGEAALAGFVPCDRRWRRRFVARTFHAGLCAYAPHHARLLDAVHRELAGVGGLYLTGDYVQGASIEACFRSASACVGRIGTHEEQRAGAGVHLLEIHAQRSH